MGSQVPRESSKQARAYVLGSEELLGCGVVLEDLVAFFGQEFD